MMEKSKEKDIISAIIDGEDQYVLSILYKTVLPKVKKWIMSNNGDEEEAKDIFQDAVLAFYKQVKTGKFNTAYEPAAFVYTVTRNLWINRVKKANRTSKLTNEQEIVVSDKDFMDDMITSEKEEAIRSVMGQIGEECQKLLSLSTYQGLSMKEICSKMGYSSESVARTYNYRCKQKLVSMVRKNNRLMDLFR